MRDGGGREKRVYIVDQNSEDSTRRKRSTEVEKKKYNYRKYYLLYWPHDCPYLVFPLVYYTTVLIQQ